ncbi:MAG TPA: sulfatase [Vicinamibacterales bacterium]|nr:sulfatase [Vicinamibacterales bacterium]
MTRTIRLALAGGIAATVLALVVSPEWARPGVMRLPPAAVQASQAPRSAARNIVIVVTDDHRYDAMGMMGHPFLETPHLDSLAKNGVHLRNAFVTTALCSPSRASILTGQYAHRHRVVDNNNPIPPGTTFFAEYLQRAGYDTAFVGKWHMGGESDDPQPGFSHWVSFRGQGTYLPGKNGLNVNGRRVPQKGYITDELTDYAMEWLAQRPAGRPFLLMLSHKAVHSEFIPAERHRGRYAGKALPSPPTMKPPPPGWHKPMWTQNQRNSWHGMEFPYHSDLDVAEYYRRYAETLLAVDESLGRVLGWLRERNLFDSTLVLYLGDNGFMFGEQGLIDKRASYEASMRIPFLLQCPELFKPGTVLPQVVANIDIAPTLLEVAGVKVPATMDGRSLLPLAGGPDTPWRDALLYEYYWERNFPHTPTQHALRTDRYKYIRYHGIWDSDELYDLANDPHEAENLARRPGHAQTVRDLNRRLFEILAQTDGLYIPLYPDRGGVSNLRRAGGSRAADFPADYYVAPRPPPGQAQ